MVASHNPKKSDLNISKTKTKRMANKDPTVMFTVLVVQAPLVLHAVEHGLAVAFQASIQYLLSPTMIASYLYLFLVVYVAHAGETIKLSKRDQMAAYWFLMNGECGGF